ncbi:MAG: SGNH/GDSL hydrolase family protein, partial [Opitutales bacterium]
MMRRIFTLTCLALLPTSGLLSALESTRSGLSHEASAGELKRMEAEPVVFCKDLEARLARLLFEPTKIIRVQRANQSQVYEEGVDFTLEGRTLRLTKNSRIPMLQYYSQKQIEDLYRFKEPKGFIYSPGGVIKHNDYDIVVTYEYQNGAYADFFAGCAASDALTALDKLRSGEETTVAFFGDSITVGAQASGALGQKAAPYQEGYAKLVFNALQLKFPDARMHYVNQSVGGKKSEWGLENLPSVLETNPDVLVLAFGMNDGATASKDYLKSMREMVKL